VDKRRSRALDTWNTGERQWQAFDISYTIQVFRGFMQK
jgi:hypothetical protein